ncbi:hypothetical protein MY04_5247 [Flammeovirga sp. MY04]|uniref:hypothetical protein n=1 Tax=Flammeovirga sp. MY04 TaxID=1191459 RepID=UPI000806396A|nr:hypothetical protein [Flammeovirga sp. MY04]ANQ52579.1 hypothetical protein MY04_5247 [Flammeovirga sp. MY04]
MKKNSYTILISIIIIFVFFLSKPIFESYKNTDTLINKIGCRLYEFNSINVKSNVDLKKIEIRNNGQIVFANGHQKNNMKQEYGHTTLEVYYDNLLITEISHFKSNNWYVNQYDFIITETNNEIKVSYSISGPNSKTDSYQKRYIYDQSNNLIRNDYYNLDGEKYDSRVIM